MLSKFILTNLGGGIWVAGLLAQPPVARAQTLFDASLGTLPEAQGWTYGAAGIGSVNKTAGANSALLDTTAYAGAAGWSLLPTTPLNRANGFSLLFDVQVNAETHSSTNRAGFSVICLGSDTNGIELGFWNNTIFAQSDSPLFTHAEEASFNTTSGFINYSLTFQGSNYVLQANGTTILSGRARNYTAFSGPVNPYETPNFIFCGDDTGSASGSVNLRSVGLVLPPKLNLLSPAAFSWTGVSNQTYRVLGSTNLLGWSLAGTVTSASNTFRFTGTPGPAQQFYRVVFP